MVLSGITPSQSMMMLVATQKIILFLFTLLLLTVYKSVRFGVFNKVVQDSLPSLFLKFRVIFRFSIKGCFDNGFTILRCEQGRSLSSVTHGVSDFFM